VKRRPESEPERKMNIEVVKRRAGE